MFAGNPSLTSVHVSPNILATAFGICALAGAWIFHRRSSSHQEYFPSPPSDTFLGHLRIMPLDFLWLTELAKTLGDVIHVSIFGQPMIILNTAEAARDLMEKRGANYSDRPTTTLLGKMINWGNMLAFVRYGDRFRAQRRFVHQYLNSQASASFRPAQTQQAKILVKNLLKNPTDFRKHINRMSSASVVKLTYGHDILSDDDEYTNLAVAATSRAVASVQYIPSWFPGASFKSEARLTRKLSDEMIYSAYNRVKEERASGTAQPSLLNSLLEDYEKTNAIDKDHELNMIFATGNMYAAGVETSEVAVVTFILMMARNPEVVKRAQEEIDRVVGTEQLPTPEDRPNLPYVESIMKEVFRINPPLPLNLPHRSMKEDVYRDKVIPADTLLLANVWNMMRDETYYQDTEKFYPERFLPKVMAPGYDFTKVCPGRFFADTSVWLAIANILAVFDILPAIDPVTGKEMPPAAEYVPGFTNKPKLFDCRINPRSDKHISLINQECN
ncbi:hypothetical protein EW145_g2433 [Phellinidium pouzarii]|uniref:Cytochrome P450 n=1 Tax=Phellinidium pouzarii TaxID=167371 RepID=A0A4V3XD88_9AGAM|nr:hypothetical protein EW145_g2433 [Phellinidium pouzarii]